MKRFILTITNELGTFKSAVLEYDSADIEVIDEAASGRMITFHMKCDGGIKLFPKEVLTKSVFSIELV